MKIQEVVNRNQEREFLNVARVIYRDDPVWVCPLDKDISSYFNPVHNPHIRNGEVKRWILKKDNGRLIGRIAAFYNREKTSAGKVPSGGAGFFECINDQNAAKLLFDAAGEWLRSKNMKAMDAPVNPGENDSNWGLLVEGFTHPAYGMPYHKPYYRKLFEDYGFQVYFRQFSYHLDLKKKFPERFWKIAEWIGKKPDFAFRSFSWKEADKFVDDLVTIYNSTWSHTKENVTPLLKEDVKETLKKARPILDPDIIWFAYFKDEPIGFFILFPDVNQILKKFNGRLNLINKLKFLYYVKKKTMTRIRAQVAGIVPKFQNSGVESGIFWHMNERMKNKKHFEEIELSWVGDFNPKMVALYEAVGGEKAKIHHTYRIMLDKNIPFERFMPEKLENAILRKLSDTRNPQGSISRKG